MVLRETFLAISDSNEADSQVESEVEFFPLIQRHERFYKGTQQLLFFQTRIRKLCPISFREGLLKSIKEGTREY